MVADEATAAMAAGVYGELRGSPAVCFGITGPGAANMVGGVTNCFLDRMPVLALTSRQADQVLDRTIFQNIDQQQLYSAVVKKSMTLDPDTAHQTLAAAVALAVNERPGPVHIDLPKPHADAKVRDSMSGQEPHSFVDQISGDLGAVRDRLLQSNKLLIIAGTDALRMGSRDELVRLAESYKAAVLSAPRARGVFPEDHPRYAGPFMGLFSENMWETDFLSQTDMALLVGVDPIEMHKPWPHNMPSIQLQTMKELAEPSPDTRFKLYGPLRKCVARLYMEKAHGFTTSEIKTLKKNARDRFADAGQTSIKIFEKTRQLLPDDGILVLESAINNLVAEHLWPVPKPGTYISPGGSRTIGSVVPHVIGACLAKPDVPVIGICGDGGGLMRLAELETIMRTHIRPVLVIFNDAGYGTIQSQQSVKGLPNYGLSLGPVNFATIATDFGLRGVTVDTLDGYEKELETAFFQEKATVIDFKIEPDSYQKMFAQILGLK